VFFKIKLPASTAPARVEAEAGLSAFASESAPSPGPVAEHRTEARAKTSARGADMAKLAMVIAATAVVTASATMQYRRFLPASGTLVVETSVPGQEVTVGGNVVGRTPVTLSLKPGTYGVQVGQGELKREMSVDLAAGASIVRHLDLNAPQTVPAVQTQRLRIESETPASAVLVDGVDRGPTPINVEGLAPGAHDVVVRAGGTTLRHRVSLHPGDSTVMVFAAAAKPAETTTAAAPASGGFLAVNSGVAVQIREGGRVIGSNELERLMLPTGEHTLEFVNEALGYQTRKTVRIEAGKTANVQLERVNGVLSVNAMPWAEVWIGGERIGQTPIGNLSRPIGTYDVVLRHPELGERRERVTITTKGPARLGVDLRRK
jgi:PEGA domain